MCHCEWIYISAWKLRRWIHGRVLLLILLTLVALSCVSYFNNERESHFECPCRAETKTEERVDRYLSLLLTELNAETKRTVGEDGESEHPSMAIRFLASVEAAGKRCAATPGFFDVKHRNSVWQVATVDGSTFLLYSAFFDFRDVDEGPLVRIVAMSDSGWPGTPTCHFYNSGSPTEPPIATKAIRVDFVHWDYPKQDSWHPFLITCRVQSIHKTLPDVVSIVSYPCSKPSNALRVLNQRRPLPQKKDLVLCHKFLFNPNSDYSFRLIEWIELARVWGVDHITLYLAGAHSKVKRVLNHYENAGFLTVLPWMNPGDQLNIPSLLRSLYDTQRYVLFTNENIPYTDCLLRHIETHRYVGVWDIDEFVFPATAKSLPDMVDTALFNWRHTVHPFNNGLKPPTSYLARSSYFFDDKTDEEFLHKIKDYISENIHIDNMDIDRVEKLFPILSHTLRTVKLSPPAVFTKSIHDTSRALGLHAHFALHNLEGEINRERDLYHLCPDKEGFLGHFRSKCQGEDQSECNETFRSDLKTDTTMWTHALQVIRNALTTIRSLNLEAL